MLLSHLFTVHRTTTHHYFAILIRIKTVVPTSITLPQFVPIYRTSSPLITVPKTLPWQTNNISSFSTLLNLIPSISQCRQRIFIIFLHIKMLHLDLPILITLFIPIYSLFSPHQAPFLKKFNPITIHLVITIFEFLRIHFSSI